MKLLFIHSDHITYKTTRKTKSEVIENEVKEPVRIEDCLVVQISVEKTDVDESVEKAVSHTTKIAKQVKAKKIVLFAFAHLSNELADPKKSVKLLDALTEKLRGEGYEVFRVPFGWYKAWEIKNKGHPLSVLSRSI